MDPPIQSNTEVQLLIEKQPIDKPDDLEKDWRKQFLALQALFSDNSGVIPTLKSEQEINKILLSEANDPKRNSDIMVGLLYGFLSNQESGDKYLQYIHWVVRDKFTWCTSQIRRLTEKYRKLTEVCRFQLLCLINKFLEEDIPQFSEVVTTLMRQIVTGNTSKENIWLIEQLLDICIRHTKFVNSVGENIPIIFLTFASLVLDHLDPSFTELRTKEVQLCMKLFNEKFPILLRIGRDLARVIDNCVRKKIPEFESIWDTMLHNPTQLSSDFTDIISLLSIRTPRIYIASRVTFEMEQWLLFIMKHVNLGGERRYEEWFRERYLAAELSDNLIPDLIRFIVCCFHPDNRMLSSDLVPRWIVIGWLLKCCKSKESSESAQLALFYDFLFFEGQADKIMSIEPAMLLLMRSIPKYTEISASLLEFLLRQLDKYEGELKNKVKHSIQSSLSTCLKMGVVQSLSPLVQYEGFDPSLRTKIIDPSSPFAFIMKEANLQQPLQQVHHQTNQTPPIHLHTPPQALPQPSPLQTPPTQLSLSQPQSIPSGAVQSLPVQQGSAVSTQVGQVQPQPRPVSRSSNGPPQRGNTKSQSKLPPSLKVEGTRGPAQLKSTPPLPAINSTKPTLPSSLSPLSLSSTLSPQSHAGRSKQKRSLSSQVKNLKRPHEEITLLDGTGVPLTKKPRTEGTTTLITSVDDDDRNDVFDRWTTALEQSDAENAKTTTEMLEAIEEEREAEVVTDSSEVVSSNIKEEPRHSSLFYEVFGDEIQHTLTLVEDPGRVQEAVERMLNVLVSYRNGEEHNPEETEQTLFSDLALFMVENLFEDLKETKAADLLDKKVLNTLLYPIIFDKYIQLHKNKLSKEENGLSEKSKKNTLLYLMTEINKLESSWGFRFLSYLVVRSNLYVPAVSNVAPVTVANRNRTDSEDSDSDYAPETNDPDKDAFDMLMKCLTTDADPDSTFGPYLTWLDFRMESSKETPKSLFSLDVQICADTNNELFLELIPILFKYFTTFTVGNPELISVVCSLVHPTKLHFICCRLIMEEFELIGLESVSTVLVHSLKWESLEQYCFWQLMDAEFSQNNIAMEEHLAPFLENHVIPSEHPEALHGIMILLSSVSPTKQLLDLLLNLPLSFSRFTSLMMARWSNSTTGGEKELTEQLVASLAALPKRRGRAGKKVETARRVLRHLSLLRVFQESMLFETTIVDEDSLFNNQEILKHIRTLIESNSLQMEFPKLYALTEESTYGGEEK